MIYRFKNQIDEFIPVEVPGASVETAAPPLEPVVWVGGLIGRAESGVTDASPLEQVVGDRG